ncbi:CFI-box-CTERM domain-containing protein [Geobacter sp.]|uniref:CFI-box-CTERM domain-containing protein n=1 Tax=Geobacter sp. TaxID=46610 RepID=UPI0027B994E0|nr:CFI-box-CTERM domain-containing protein [Geobacter sp.]
MTIRIRQTPFDREFGDNPGTFEVHPDLVLAQIGVIAMAGSEDLPETLGEEPDPGDPDYQIVTYDPGPQDTTTPAGRVRQLLKDLVDSPSVITLIGLGPDFVYPDGYTFEDSAATTYTGGNPDILYDTHNCDGDGRWMTGTDGSEVCTTSAAILFHELCHVHLGHPGADYETDEQEAVGAENDLHLAEGRTPRDPNQREVGCGCPDGCCIVASVASGSPFAPEVNALRQVRDRVLRRTETGMHFFDAFFSEYYSFSVPVARIMARDEATRETVAAWLVRPLVKAWDMALAYIRQPGDGTGLEELAREAMESGETYPSWFSWRQAREVLEQAAAGGSLPAPAGDLGPELETIRGILGERLPACPHVRWGIVAPLAIYARLQEFGQGRIAPQAMDRWLKEALDEWLAALPLEYLQTRMTPEELAHDLPELSTILFSSPESRSAFGARFVKEFSVAPDSRVAEKLRREGYSP